MKWKELDDKERVRLVLLRVMGYFVLEQTAKGYATPELEQAPAGFHWPIAFWNTDGECWMTKDIATDPTIFDPLHDLNTAWKIAELFDEIVLSRHRPGKVRCELYERATMFGGVGKTPHEAICLAALVARGVDVE